MLARATIALAVVSACADGGPVNYFYGSREPSLVPQPALGVYENQTVSFVPQVPLFRFESNQSVRAGFLETVYTETVSVTPQLIVPAGLSNWLSPREVEQAAPLIAAPPLAIHARIETFSVPPANLPFGTSVPEPATLSLLMAGLAAGAVARRYSRRAN